MQEKRLTRDNYNAPRGEENVVHYYAEREQFDKGQRISHPDLLKTGVKMFDKVKRNLELQGYTIEVLYHPQGKYNEVVRHETDLEVRERELDEAQKRIAQLEAKLAKAEADEPKKKTTKK